jgi:hypothetical protein
MSICLNMIVKNESAILRSTLENLTKYIKFSYWVICDTGSTDGTQDIIKTFFAGKNIPGELHEDKWENFGHNRTLALERAYKKSDYILIFDADDSFKGNFKLPKLESTAAKTPNTIDRISCKFGYGDDFTWYRPVILNNNIKWKYFGVLHEYIDCIEPGYQPVSINVDGDYYIEARTIGGDRNRDDKKYYKDAILLEKALEEETDQGLKSRYTFYCAQSFRDYHDFPNAIKYYLMRTTQGCFEEEIHVSYFNAGKLMIGVNEMRKTNETLPSYSEQEIEKTLFDGWKMMRDRSECLYELAKYYRIKGDYDKGYFYAKIGSKIPFPTHRVLFLYKDVYNWRLKDELGICSYYIGRYNESIRACQKIMRTNVDQRLIQNMYFSVNVILKSVTTIPSRMVILTKNRLLGLTLVINYKETMDLVKILINSLILNVKDIYKIERIIISCPDKKVKELEEFKISFPFFEIVSYKHPSHLLGNIKSKLNRNDRYIFYLEDGWIAFTQKTYFNKSLSILNYEKKYGQFIYNRENGVSIDAYLSKAEGVSFPDPKDNDNEKKKYYENTKYKTPATSPVLFRREFFDAMTTFENPVDEPFTTIFQNEINFSKIKKQEQ